MIRLALLFLLGVGLVNVSIAEESAVRQQFTYAWPFLEDDEMRPRGGNTRGPRVVLDRQPHKLWKALQTPGLTKQERDRRAILAMAGGFRVSFDFIETIGFVDEFVPDNPYQSWATEYVYIVDDEPDFVSLQHIIVMYFETPEGEIVGPVVIKHWRQDWQYEDADLHVFIGRNAWQRRSSSMTEVRGTWSQSVYQVDDSPRYQAIGSWTHEGNYSSWLSENTWRPLPRREFSVRSDYHVLSGTNRHTITPTGWVQEEDNLKLVLDEAGNPDAENPYLAREAGLNRYERIVEHDFSAGDDYWSATGPFWADVRAAWNKLFEGRERFSLKSVSEDQRLFEAMFAYAATLEETEQYDSTEGRRFIEETLERFLDD